MQWDDLGCVAATLFDLEKFIHLLEIEQLLCCIQNNCQVLCVYVEMMQRVSFMAQIKFNEVLSMSEVAKPSCL